RRDNRALCHSRQSGNRKPFPIRSARGLLPAGPRWFGKRRERIGIGRERVRRSPFFLVREELPLRQEPPPPLREFRPRAAPASPSPRRPGTGPRRPPAAETQSLTCSSPVFSQ